MLNAVSSNSQVARHFGCHYLTILCLQQRIAATGNAADRRRPGRKRATTPAQDRHIHSLHLQDRFRTSIRTASALQPRVSARTVHCRLHNIDLHAH